MLDDKNVLDESLPPPRKNISMARKNIVMKNHETPLNFYASSWPTSASSTVFFVRVFLNKKFKELIKTSSTLWEQYHGYKNDLKFIKNDCAKKLVVRSVTRRKKKNCLKKKKKNDLWSKETSARNLFERQTSSTKNRARKDVLWKFRCGPYAMFLNRSPPPWPLVRRRFFYFIKSRRVNAFVSALA